MRKSSRSFQVFVKPAGALCNLNCSYCYYLEKKQFYPDASPLRMSYDILEAYIRQHIYASPDSVIRFSWHGGEPVILGLDYFQKILEIQNKYQPANKRIINGIQTNGTLLTGEWCSFLADNRFSVGLSLDGPQDIHDSYRITVDGKTTHKQVMRGYNLLKQYGLNPDRIYEFFRQIGAEYIGFLPLVKPLSGADRLVSPDTVPSEAFGNFLCTVFNEWKEKDIGAVKIQLFEETARTALNQEHELCIFRKTCGDIPVIEHNGDFFSCDHFVNPEHRIGNILNRSLADLLEHPDQLNFGQNKYNGLPLYCCECDYLAMCNGECPKNRFIKTPDNEDGLNYLCAGYKIFFNHSKSFMNHLAALWNNQNSVKQNPAAGARQILNSKTGRNEPCPCGSGKKYKKCCLRN